MQHAAIAYTAVVVDDGIAVYLGLGPYLGVAAYRDVRMQYASLAYLYAFGDSHEGADVAVFADLCAGVDEGQLAYALALRLHALVYLE